MMIIMIIITIEIAIMISTIINPGVLAAASCHAQAVRRDGLSRAVPCLLRCAAPCHAVQGYFRKFNSRCAVLAAPCRALPSYTVSHGPISDCAIGAARVRAWDDRAWALCVRNSLAHGNWLVAIGWSPLL